MKPTYFKRYKLFFGLKQKKHILRKNHYLCISLFQKNIKKKTYFKNLLKNLLYI